MILGICNCCGECEIGSNNPNIIWVTQNIVGEPYAEYDITFGKRKDIPVTPSISKCPNCTLRGVYL